MESRRRIADGARQAGRRAVLLLLVLSVLACEGERNELQPLEEPALERLEPGVRTQLEKALSRVRQLAAQPGVDRRTLGMSYGDLGRMYQVYELFDAAIPCYRNAQTLLPDDYRWPYYLGHVNRSLFRAEPARLQFERAERLNPTYSPAVIEQARIDREEGRSDEAAVRARRVLEANPDSAAAALLLAELAQDRGDAAEAASWYERLLETQPRATRLYQPLAMAYQQLGQSDKAREALARRGDGHLSGADPLMNELDAMVSSARRFQSAGVASYQRGDFPAAVRSFEQALEADPDYIGARLNLGSALVRLGRLDEAREQYEQALVLDPSHAMAHFNVGIILSQQGQEAVSIECFERALEADPDYRNARLALGNALLRTGSCDGAIEHYGRLLEIDPGSVGARIGEVVCLVQLERFQQARTRIEEGLRSFPGNPALAQAAARILSASPQNGIRDGARAVVLADEVVAANRSPLTLETRAMALAEVGRFEEAVSVQREASALAASATPKLKSRLRTNLELYERGRPCRDPAVMRLDRRSP